MKAIVLLLLLGAACTPPCDQLADYICRCNPDASSRTACLQEISAEDAVVHATTVQQTFCSEELKTCTCFALAHGERQLCGLTLESQ